MPDLIIGFKHCLCQKITPMFDEPLEISYLEWEQFLFLRWIFANA